MSRNALVTGAARGIGRAIALRLARDGLNVAVNDIETSSAELDDTKKAIEEIGRKSIAIIADVSNEEAVVTMMQNAAKELGSLDVVVANAGIGHPKPLLEISAKEWDETMAVNLRGVFLCYREAAKIMIAQGKGGKIIGACSAAAYKYYPFLSHYNASKWAIRGLTRDAAVEFAKHRITVNAYCPGAVETTMLNTGLEQMRKLQNITHEEMMKGFLGTIPLGHISEPDDIANFVSYLASKDSDYMTGQSVIIDGGYTSL